MADRKFKISIDVNAREAARDLKAFNDRLDQTNKKQKENQTGAGASTASLGKFGGAASAAGIAVAGMTAAVAGAVASYVALNSAVLGVAQRVRDLDNFARTAEVSVQQMQALTIATQRYGVTGEQTSEIIQDINDKLGDFISTGAGPFVDFFDAIAGKSDLTADALQRLSGPDVLIALKEAMDDANLSTERQTFLLESLGSDLSKLSPLLKNQAAELREVESALDAVSAFYTPAQIQALSEYQDEVAILNEQWEQMKTILATNMVPLLEKVNGVISSILSLGADDNNGISRILPPSEQLDEQRKALEKINQELEKTNKTILQPVGGIGPIQAQAVQAPNPAFFELEQKRKATLEEIKRLEGEILKDKENQEEAERQMSLRRQEYQDQLNTLQAKQIAGVQEQTALLNEQLVGLSMGTEQYKAIVAEQEKSARLAQWKLNLEKQNIVVTQEMENQYVKMLDLQAQVQQQTIATAEAERQKAEQLAEAERKRQAVIAEAARTETTRIQNFARRETQMRREIELLGATNEQQREAIRLEHEIQDLGLTGAEANTLRALQDQINAREEHRRVMEAERDAVLDLAEATGRWASGSKEAIKTVIAELIRLVALRAFGGTNPLLSSFLSGFGSGGIRGYADGGQFNAGETFVVGERGPEIITASSPGSVISNERAFGGGASINITPTLTVNGSVTNKDELQVMFEEFSQSVAGETQRMIMTQLRPKGVFS